MQSWMLYPPRWKTPNVHLCHYLGHNNINVHNCNRINVVMASPKCMNKNLFEMVSSCVWNKA